MQPDLMPPDDADGVSSITTADPRPVPTVKLVLLDSADGNAVILEAVAIVAGGSFEVRGEVTQLRDESGPVGAILSGILRKWLLG